MPVILAMVLAGAIGAGSQSPPAKSKAPNAAAPAEAPTVQQILERYVAALGGREAYEKISSRTYRGTVKMKMGPDELPDGRVEFLTKAPDRVRITFDIKGIFIEEGFDGHTAWEFNSVDGGVRLRRGERAERERIEAQFHSDTRLAELFPEMKFIGAGTVNSAKTYMVEALSTDGLKRIYHFSAANGLVVRIEDHIRENGRVDRHITDLRDYRAFGGVKIPTLMHIESPDLVVTISFTEIRQNVPIDETRFKRPKAEPR